jgi:hypothetical protein
MKKNYERRLFAFLKLMFVVAFATQLIPARANTYNNIPKAIPQIVGRWDITVYVDGKQSPSWLEVQTSGYSMLVGQFVGAGGSARPISRVNFDDNKLSFAIPPQWQHDKGDLSVEGTLAGDSLSGTMVFPDGKKYNWSGVRAPSLKRSAEPLWQKPIQLFNGKDLTGWHASKEPNQWIVKDGVLSSPQTGANLLSDQTFNDFKLHVEFRYPADTSNSGIYLRGRYEVQIEASHNNEPIKNVFSGVYGFIEPTEMAAKKPGEWQSFDITLTGRMVTIVANGKTVICNREIPGPTGGAIDSKEGEPGPIYIQGDHGAIEFRNIVITPAK